MARQHIFTDTQPPTVAPMFLGDHFVNTANEESYFSTLTGDVSGWVGMMGHNKGLGENTAFLSFDSSMTFPEMQAEIDKISNRHNRDDYLKIEFASGTYTSIPSDLPLSFEGFVGRAVLIYGDTPDFSTTAQTVIIDYTSATDSTAPIIDIDSCNCPFDIRYIRFIGNDCRGMVAVQESVGTAFIIGCSFAGLTNTSEVFSSNAHADTVSMLYNRYDKARLFNVDDASIRLFDTLPDTIVPDAIGFCDNSSINFDNSFIETALGIQATNNNTFDINIATVTGDVTHDIFGYARAYVCDNTSPIVINIDDDATFAMDSPVNLFSVFQGNTGAVIISGGNTANLVGGPHTLAGRGDFRQIKRLNANRWEMTNTTPPLSAILAHNNKTSGSDIIVSDGDSIVGEDFSGVAPTELLLQGGTSTGVGNGGDVTIQGGITINPPFVFGDVNIGGSTTDEVTIHNVTYPDETNASVTGDVGKVLRVNGIGSTEYEFLSADDIGFDGSTFGLTTTDVSGTLLETLPTKFSVGIGASSSQIIDSFVPTIERTSVYDYVIYDDGVASRAGEVRSVFDPTNTNISFYETTTTDITSTTSAVVMDVIFTGSAVELRAVNSAGSTWSVAGKREKF